MAAVFLKTVTLQTIKTEQNCLRRCLGEHMVQKVALAQLPLVASAPTLSERIHAKAFSTVGDTQDERKKRKKNETDFSNIGRKISERIIHLFDEKGNDLGNLHRADVIRLMDERDLRLVQRKPSTGPPEYQLMTGTQIHEERLRLREREKARPKTGPALTKELTFSSNIGQHDLDTKSKQIQQWIEKNYKVQVTIKKAKNVEEPENKMEELFNQILQTMPGIATFSSRPQPVKGGKAVTCVFRHLSKKEETAYRETQEIREGNPMSKEKGKDRESDILHQ
ncbi:translation initiation factor IF-3, mitochondrial [Saccopteryx leptura]|uniref:translation initiation factor IF-3, mitochondrial n=1 Tax=Saccopteryx leptura TaxID=249018 RepID=UPI00339CAE54